MFTRDESLSLPKFFHFFFWQKYINKGSCKNKFQDTCRPPLVLSYTNLFWEVALSNSSVGNALWLYCDLFRWGRGYTDIICKGLQIGWPSALLSPAALRVQLLMSFWLPKRYRQRWLWSLKRIYQFYVSCFCPIFPAWCFEAQANGLLGSGDGEEKARECGRWRLLIHLAGVCSLDRVCIALPAVRLRHFGEVPVEPWVVVGHSQTNTAQQRWTTFQFHLLCNVYILHCRSYLHTHRSYVAYIVCIALFFSLCQQSVNGLKWSSLGHFCSGKKANEITHEGQILKRGSGINIALYKRRVTVINFGVNY